MMLSQLSLRVEDGLTPLTFTNAARGNPMNGGLCNEISEAVIQLSGAREGLTTFAERREPTFKGA